MATFTTSSGDLYNPRLIAPLMKEGLKYEKDTFAETMFTKVTTEDKSVRSSSISTNRYLTPKAEDEVAAGVDIIQGWSTEIPWSTYGSSRQVTKDSMILKNGATLEQIVTDFTEDMLRTRDAYAMAIFRRAFDTSTLIGDGAPLISTLHPLKIGGSQANTFTDTQKPFGYIPLLQATDLLDSQLDNSGNPIVSSGKYTVLIPRVPQLMEQVWQIIGGGNEMKPGTNNNDKNYFTKYEGLRYNMIVCDPLRLNTARAIGETTDTLVTQPNWNTRWFLMDEQRAKECLQMVVPTGAETMSQILETESFAKKGIFEARFGFGVAAGISNWIVGSKGDNSASNF